MSERKLVRADVRMCPECGEEVRFKEHPYKPPGQGHFWCAPCELWMDKTDYGYYPPDVTAVVKGLRLYVSLPGQPPSVKLLREWLDELEGKK